MNTWALNTDPIKGHSELFTCLSFLIPVAKTSGACGGWETRGLLLTRTSTLGVKSDWDAPWQGAAGGWHIPGSTSTMGHGSLRPTNPNKGTHRPSCCTSNNVSSSWQRTCLRRDTSRVTGCTLSRDTACTAHVSVACNSQCLRSEQWLYWIHLTLGLRSAKTAEICDDKLFRMIHGR